MPRSEYIQCVLIYVSTFKRTRTEHVWGGKVFFISTVLVNIWALNLPLLFCTVECKASCLGVAWLTASGQWRFATTTLQSTVEAHVMVLNDFSCYWANMQQGKTISEVFWPWGSISILQQWLLCDWQRPQWWKCLANCPSLLHVCSITTQVHVEERHGHYNPLYVASSLAQSLAIHVTFQPFGKSIFSRHAGVFPSYTSWQEENVLTEHLQV